MSGKAQRSKGRSGRGARKYSITTPCIVAYAKFKATPYTLRESIYGVDVKSEEQYFQSIGMKRTRPPESWQNVVGFWELVGQFEKGFDVQYRILAKNALADRLRGVTVTRTERDANDRVTGTLEETLPPDVKAAEIVLKSMGALVERQEVQHSGEVNTKAEYCLSLLSKAQEAISQAKKGSADGDKSPGK